MADTDSSQSAYLEGNQNILDMGLWGNWGAGSSSPLSAKQDRTLFSLLTWTSEAGDAQMNDAPCAVRICYNDNGAPEPWTKRMIYPWHDYDMENDVHRGALEYWVANYDPLDPHDGSFDGVWWAVDLREAQKVTGWFIHHIRPINGLNLPTDVIHRARNVEVYSSSNGTSWNLEDSVSGMGITKDTYWYQAYLPSPITKRYWKFFAETDQGGWLIHWWAVRNFGLTGDSFFRGAQEAYCEGLLPDPVDTDDSQSAYMEGGAGQTEQVPAFISGALAADSSKSAFISSGIAVSDNKSSFIDCIGIANDSVFAYLMGDQKESQSAYLEGVMYTVNGTQIVIIGGVLYG